MNNLLNIILNDLRSGSIDSAYTNKEFLNQMASMIYTKPVLSVDDVENLKGIITICNIVYNDTDKELMVIEDGFYDQLLELYKRYDPLFQVGAEVIKFKPSEGFKFNASTNTKLKPAVHYLEMDQDLHFGDQLLVSPTKFLDYRDLVKPSIVDVMTERYINKRTHDVGHNHPELVGTLDKCKFVYNHQARDKGAWEDPSAKIVERDFFMDHVHRGILNPRQIFDIVLELKYDGISIEADCTDIVVSARSRGDTGVGKASDMTPILQGYRFPHRTPGARQMGVKFEAIITKTDLPYFNRAKGYEYKNCRSAIVGLLSSSDAWKYRDFITLVPLALEREAYENECHCNRIEEIEYLNREFISKGCPLRYSVCRGNLETNLRWIDLFTREAESSRGMIPFMYDGIVLSYLDENIRRQLGRENFINKYSVAVKFEPLLKRTTFRYYTYTVGQDGTITPIINYDPVEFFGTIHPKSSGHSYARFKELDLHSGDIIDVEYRNDVMPYVSVVLDELNLMNRQMTKKIEFPKFCPICHTPLVFSDKSARCINPLCSGKCTGRLVATCSKLMMYGFGEATIIKLRVNCLSDIVKLLYNNMGVMSDMYMRGFGPVETTNLAKEVTKLMTRGIDEAELLGAIGFTSISTKTWQLILNYVKYSDIAFAFTEGDSTVKDQMVMLLSSIDGIGFKTVAVIRNEFPYFVKDLDFMYAYAKINKYVNVSLGKKIRATGFRDKELFNYLRNELHLDADDNAPVTKDTAILLVPMAGHKSSKVDKAEKYGVQIVPLDDFRNNMNIYLN